MGRRAFISVPQATGLPGQIFFATQGDRVRLAREKFFERGEPPIGLVPEEVIQSWKRCRLAGISPHRSPSFDPLPRSRLNDVLQKSRPLLDASHEEFERLVRALRATGCHVALMDATPTMLRISPISSQDGPMLKISGRPGMRFDEMSVGTGASNLAVRTGQTFLVDADEHYWNSMHFIRCAAAPIRTLGNQVAGALCILSEGRPMNFNPLGLVESSAAIIENRLLVNEASGDFVVHFHVDANCIGTSMEALLIADGTGRLLGRNAAAMRCLDPRVPLGETIESVLDTSLERLLARSRFNPVPVLLAGGLQVWACAQRRQDGRSVPAVAGAAPATRGGVIEDVGQELIQAELQRQRGNISATARVLGVSRNFLYRRLRVSA